MTFPWRQIHLPDSGLRYYRAGIEQGVRAAIDYTQKSMCYTCPRYLDPEIFSSETALDEIFPGGLDHNYYLGRFLRGIFLKKAVKVFPNDTIDKIVERIIWYGDSDERARAEEEWRYDEYLRIKMLNCDSSGRPHGCPIALTRSRIGSGNDTTVKPPKRMGQHESHE